MTYVVTSGHVECLKSGRLVAPGAEVTNAEAKQNPRLIERGSLTEREAPKPKSKPAPKPPAEKPDKPATPSTEPEKEDDK